VGTRPWGNPQEKSPPLMSKASVNFNAMFDSAMERRENLHSDKSDKAELAAYREADQGRSGAGSLGSQVYGTKGPADSVQLTAVQAEALQKSIQAGKAPRLFQDASGNWSAKFQ
jgi:hypothetical protein